MLHLLGFHSEVEAQIFGHILNPDPLAHSLVAADTVSESADADVSTNANKASISSESENLSYTAQETAEAGSPETEDLAAPQTGEPIIRANDIKVHSSLEDKVDDEAPKQASDHNSPSTSIEITQQEAEMSSGSESTPMVESSDSSRESESVDRGVSVQQRETSSSDSSDQSMEESSSAEMEIDEIPAQIARLPVQTAESSSEESSEESSDNSDEDSESDGTAQQDGGVQAAIRDAEMPDASDTSSDDSASESEEEELEPEAAISAKAADLAVATPSSNQAASSPTPTSIPGLQHTVPQTPATAASTVSAPVQKSVATVENNEVDTMGSISPKSR